MTEPTVFCMSCQAPIMFCDCKMELKSAIQVLKDRNSGRVTSRSMFKAMKTLNDELLNEFMRIAKENKVINVTPSEHDIIVDYLTVLNEIRGTREPPQRDNDGRIRLFGKPVVIDEP